MELGLPAKLSWVAYLQWSSPDARSGGVYSRSEAQPVIEEDSNDLYHECGLTLRYTACGGLVNQHYCHLAALTLAHLANASCIIWPPMQERASFNRRYSQRSSDNEQSWMYLDATSIWDVEAISAQVQRTAPSPCVQNAVAAKTPSSARSCSNHQRS